MFQIYLIESLATLKKYVGQTSLPLRKRLQRHCWKSEDRKNMVITQAIAKYGKETFTIRKIDDARTLEEANKKEVYWCKFLNTMSPNGYNLRAGGRTYASHAPEVADKIARARLGKKASILTRQRLRDTHLGHKHSAETLLKMSSRMAGKPAHLNLRAGASRKNAKVYLLRSPEGIEVEVTNMKKFAYDNGFQNTNLSALVNGRIQSYRGWTFISDRGFVRTMG